MTEYLLNEITMLAYYSVEFCLVDDTRSNAVSKAARKGVSVRRGVKFHKALLGMHGFAVLQRSVA